jgi:hypothetical protein
MKRTGMVIGVLYATAAVLYAAQTWFNPLTDDFHPAWVFFVGAGLYTAYVICIAARGQQPLTRFHKVLLLITVGSALLAFPATSVDYMNYLFGGSLIHVQHISPYTVSASQLPATIFSQNFLDVWWSVNPSPYGPLWQLGMWFVNIVSANTILGGVIGIKIINLIGLLLCARFIHTLTRNNTLTMLFLMNPVVLENTIHSPHVDLWVAVGVLYALQHTETWHAGAGIAFGAMAKIHGAIFAPFFIHKQVVKKIVAGVVVTLTIVGALWLLAPFTLQQMLHANLLGSNSPSNDSPLTYLFFIGKNNPAGVFRTSLIVSGILYTGILALYYTKRLSRIDALFAAASLIPLFLTALIFPWHWLIVLTLAFVRNTKRVLWWVCTITIGGCMGELPAFAMVIAGGIALYAYRFVRPHLLDVLQYGDDAKKIHNHN